MRYFCLLLIALFFLAPVSAQYQQPDSSGSGSSSSSGTETTYDSAALGLQAGGDVYHNLSVIQSRAFPAAVIQPEEEKKINKDLGLMRLVSVLSPCAEKYAQCFEKLKSAIQHYKNAEADRRNKQELEAGNRDNNEARDLLYAAARCMRESSGLLPLPVPKFGGKPPIQGYRGYQPPVFHQPGMPISQAPQPGTLDGRISQPGEPNTGYLPHPIPAPDPNHGYLPHPIPPPDPDQGYLPHPAPEPDPSHGYLPHPSPEPDPEQGKIIHYPPPRMPGDDGRYIAAANKPENGPRSIFDQIYKNSAGINTGNQASSASAKPSAMPAKPVSPSQNQQPPKPNNPTGKPAEKPSKPVSSPAQKPNPKVPSFGDNSPVQEGWRLDGQTPNNLQWPPNWKKASNGEFGTINGRLYFKPDDQTINRLKEYGLKPDDLIPYTHGVPDFSKWAWGHKNFEIPRGTLDGQPGDLGKINAELLKQKWEGVKNKADVQRLLDEKELTAHHFWTPSQGPHLVQLVPSELHDAIRHTGDAYKLRNPKK